jgi:hypothetical protein
MGLRSHQITKVGAALLVASALTLSARAEFNLYGIIENFNWTEEIQGRQLLEEDGPLLGVGLGLGLVPETGIGARGLIELFAGEIDYDGALQDGTPLKTTTAYYGTTLEAELLYRFEVMPNLVAEPFAGLGTRIWLRELDSSEDRRYGYDEYWMTGYMTLGAAGEMTLDDRLAVFGRLGWLIALVNDERVENIPGIPGSVDLEPGKETTFFLEGGVRFERLFACLYYQTLSFPKSPTVTVGNSQLFQPDSEAKIFGIKGGLTF